VSRWRPAEGEKKSGKREDRLGERDQHYDPLGVTQGVTNDNAFGPLYNLMVEGNNRSCGVHPERRKIRHERKTKLFQGWGHSRIVSSLGLAHPLEGGARWGVREGEHGELCVT